MRSLWLHPVILKRSSALYQGNFHQVLIIAQKFNPSVITFSLDTLTIKRTHLTSNVCRIAAAQAWRCCCLTRDWLSSMKSRTGFSTLLTNGDALLGACNIINYYITKSQWTKSTYSFTSIHSLEIFLFWELHSVKLLLECSSTLICFNSALRNKCQI